MRPGRTHLTTAVGTGVLLAALGGCGSGDEAGAPAGSVESSRAAAAAAPTGERAGTRKPAPGSVKVIASRLEVPWAIAFLPDGSALVTERMKGDILRIPKGGGTPKRLMTVPGVQPEGEGGLLGIAASPDYATDHSVFVYFTAASDNRIARVDTQARSTKVIFTGIRAGAIHNGGGLAFGPDGKLYVGVGETGDTGLAQRKDTLNGKILRLNPDGSTPSGNPFGSPVWSLGHRNVQGLAFDRKGRLWASEFGQSTTDEVNLIRRGRDYGWPVVEGKGSTQGGRYTNPLVTWSPTSTSSPSGAAIVGRHLYIGALAGRKLWRIPLKGAALGRPTGLLSGRFGRIRGVVAAPNGSVWITTSNRDGRGDPTSSDDRIIQVGV